LLNGPAAATPQHVLLGVTQVGKIHRHRLGPAEQDVGKQQADQRHDDGTDQIDVRSGLRLILPAAKAVMSPKCRAT